MKALRIVNRLPIAYLAITALVFSACATADEDLGMIPPSANYSPIQAPVYPPLNQPYSPNLLDGNDSRVMNIDRLNVGEANIPGTLMSSANVSNVNSNGSINSVSSAIAPSVTSAGATGVNGIEAREYGSNHTQEYVPSYIAPSEVVPYEQTFSEPQIVPFSALPENHTHTLPTIADKTALEPKAPNIIPNSPHLESENIIELSAVGMGVAPESTISPSQALALAKRAAIIDAYRQIGEKMYGIKINAQDTVKDMVMTNSLVKARVEALIKNADIIETVYKDGLCQVTIELKLDSRTWNRILATNS